MSDKKSETNKPTRPGIGQDGLQTNGYIPERPKAQQVTTPIAPPPKNP